MHGFGPDQLARYRAALNNPAKARALEAAIDRVQDQGHVIGDPHLKRIPKEVSPEHPQANLFLYKGLYGGIHSKLEQWLYSRELVETVSNRFRTIRPLQAWLAENVTA